MSWTERQRLMLREMGLVTWSGAPATAAAVARPLVSHRRLRFRRSNAPRHRLRWWHPQTTCWPALRAAVGDCQATPHARTVGHGG
jgi:hypothetical protein